LVLQTLFNNCLANWRLGFPETSRSFHCLLANPGNPAMSPHEEGEKTGTCHTIKTVEREGGTGEEKHTVYMYH